MKDGGIGRCCVDKDLDNKKRKGGKGIRRKRVENGESGEETIQI